MWARTIVVAMLLALSATTPVGAKNRMYALVVGVSKYQTLQELPGAANDAALVSKTLGSYLNAEVQVLLDEKATRQAIKAAWESMVARAGVDDVLLFAYSGHGDRMTEAIAGDEKEGLDEVLLLSKWDAAAPSYERDVIRDNEWRGWIQAAAPRTVITIFDSCHSGTMTRNINGGGILGASRSGAENKTRAGRPTMQNITRATLPDMEIFDHEVYVGATVDYLDVREIKTAENRDHGALSYYFVRGLSGLADLDRNGRIVRGELRRYLTEAVRLATNQVQTPVIRFKGNDRADLFEVATLRELASASRLPLKVHVGGSPAARSSFESLARGLPDIRLSDAGSADLLFDAERRTVSDRGDLVAMSVGNPEQLGGVLAKWRAVEHLKALAESSPLRVELTGGDRRYCAGQEVGFNVHYDRGPGYITAFNLASDGTIQMVHQGAMASTAGGAGVFKLPAGGSKIHVGTPFGADHLIVLTTQEPPRALLEALTPNSIVSATLPWQALLGRSPGYRLGVAALFTEQTSSSPGGPC